MKKAQAYFSFALKQNRNFRQGWSDWKVFYLSTIELILIL
jgi:hypothetical protein